MSTKPSILLIGATGPIGTRVITAASEHPSKPLIHAFARTPSKLSEEERKLCTSVIQGDGQVADDIERALEETKADYVVTILGLGNNICKQDLRQRNGKALISLIGPGCKYDHVKVIVVSSLGVGDSRGKIHMGYGIWTLFSFLIRHPLTDHELQELIIITGLNHELGRSLIVRPTMLMTGKNNGKTYVFEDDEQPPSWYIDRMDLAEWIVRQICEGGKYFGKAVTLTGMP